MGINERAYWTHEAAEQIGVGESTLRKWAIELEKNGYSFLKGEQEARAFLDKDILVLIRLKELVRGERKSVKEASTIVAEEARTTPVHEIVKVEEREQAPPVPVERVEPLFTLDDVRMMIREELDKRESERVKERDESLMTVVRELQEVKKMIAASNEQKSFWSRLFKK